MYASDGSGGANSADKRIRRVGWVAVEVIAFKDANEVDAIRMCVRRARFGTVGLRQTVPRAEATAFAAAAEMAASAAREARIITDARYVYTAYQEGNIHVVAQGAIADIWRTLLHEDGNNMHPYLTSQCIKGH